MEKIMRNNFKRLRKKTNLTQDQMDKYLKIEQSSISKFEKGEIPLSVNNLEKACTLFGIKLDDLYLQDFQESRISPSFKSNNISVSTLEDISIINKLALNIIEIKELLRKNN